MKNVTRYVCSLLLVIGGLISAQVPEIKIIEADKKNNKSVELQSLVIDVAIYGNIATTTQTMVFYNHSDRILEGELTFPLPEGISVTRYAIDINGSLREAVAVNKAKATEVFESIEHQQVDPGLLEKTVGNNFRTRVYPLPAKGKRTVVIAYDQPLNQSLSNELQYYLPLSYKNTIPTFSLTTKVYTSGKKPSFEENPDGSLAFTKNNTVYEASMHKTDYIAKKSLRINIPIQKDNVETFVEENTDGSFYFLANAYPNNQTKKRVISDNIGILWDASLSGLKRDKEKDLTFLGKFIEKKKNLTIELTSFNIYTKNEGLFNIKNGDWTQLKKALEQITYDGGTDLNTIQLPKSKVEEYLLFSDGLSTFSDFNSFFKTPIHCISSSAQADYSTLKEISRQSGGQFINLLAVDMEEAFRQFSIQSLQFLGIKEVNLVREIYPEKGNDVTKNQSVTGLLSHFTNQLTLQYGYGTTVTTEIPITLTKNTTNIPVHKLWAQQKIAALDLQYEKHKETIETLGKEFTIITRNTSLLVLEQASDYVRYNITPPAELAEEYNQLIKNKQIQKEQRVNDLLARAINTTEDLKKWWNTTYQVPTTKYPKPKKKFKEEPADYDGVAFPTPPVMRAPLDTQNTEINWSENVSKPEEIINNNSVAKLLKGRVAGVRISSNTKAKEYKAVPEIKTQELNSDESYIKELEKASDAYATYLELRPDFMSTPTFFYDVAQFFYLKKEKEKALLVLSAITDMDIENTELYKLVMYKLKEKQAFKQELFIAKKIKEWRPMDPQSHRDYALALADNEKYQEALDNLYNILNASYSPESANRDYGIEEIVVTEINNLISLHQSQLMIKKIKPKIIADLPVDIRVVINWNKNDTDIDLWVTDPLGEKCYYRNKETAIGGRISNDFTSGFGPEQFMLKKAIPGKYTIETNFFGERQLSISGPTTIMAEIYLYYSDGRQSRKIITFQNTNEPEKEGVLIGEFTF